MGQMVEFKIGGVVVNGLLAILRLDLFKDDKF